MPHEILIILIRHHSKRAQLFILPHPVSITSLKTVPLEKLIFKSIIFVKPVTSTPTSTQHTSTAPFPEQQAP